MSDAVEIAGTWNGEGIDICVPGGNVTVRSHVPELDQREMWHFKGVLVDNRSTSQVTDLRVQIGQILHGPADVEETVVRIEGRFMDEVSLADRGLAVGDTIEVFGEWRPNFEAVSANDWFIVYPAP